MTELYIIGGMAFLLAGLLALACYSRFRREAGHVPRGNLPLYPARFEIYIFLNIFTIFLRRILLQDTSLTLILFSQMLVLTCVLALLLLLLPVLRKFLRAESCAFIWLSLAFLWPMAGMLPRWTISLPFFSPDISLLPLLWIWLAGFAVVMVWNVTSHLLFRRKLLANAAPVKDPLTLEIWQQQRKILNYSRSYIRLYISPDTATPLSVGLLARSACLVLPTQAYTSEELALIFRHELIHISRKDSLVKFFMSLISAFLWFNPLVWPALRTCSRDLELSCDEAVLYGRPEQTRLQYAHLLLKTAPPPYGFTTCLSASANSLRYRLRRVVKPRRRIVGSVVLGVLFFLLMVSSVCVGFRFSAQPAGEILFAQVEQSQWDVYDITYDEEGKKLKYGDCTQDAPILDYIAGLHLQLTTESPDLFAQSKHAQILLRAPKHGCMLNFFGNYVRIILYDYSLPQRHPEYSRTAYYYMDSQPDWQFLSSCIA